LSTICLAPNLDHTDSDIVGKEGSEIDFLHQASLGLLVLRRPQNSVLAALSRRFA
jgi:hypothetical protein